MPLLPRECLESQAQLRSQKALEEMSCSPDRSVPVVGGRSIAGRASREERSFARSLNATIAALKNSKSRPKATPGTNGMSKGSSLK